MSRNRLTRLKKSIGQEFPTVNSNPALASFGVLYRGSVIEAQTGPRPARVRRYPDGVQLLGGGEYFIPWMQLNTKAKLLAWVLHLAEKNWVDKEMLMDLMLAADGHWGLKITGQK